jgi:hypothetical protein
LIEKEPIDRLVAAVSSSTSITSQHKKVEKVAWKKLNRKRKLRLSQNQFF